MIKTFEASGTNLDDVERSIIGQVKALEDEFGPGPTDFESIHHERSARYVVDSRHQDDVTLQEFIVKQKNSNWDEVETQAATIVGGQKALSQYHPRFKRVTRIGLTRYQEEVLDARQEHEKLKARLRLQKQRVYL